METAQLQFSGGWYFGALPAATAAAAERFPSKPARQHELAADHVLDEIAVAWSCYRRGAAAALLDVVDCLRELRLPLPLEVAGETQYLARAALSGSDIRDPGAKNHPLKVHHEALVKRLRHAYVKQVLGEVASAEHWRTSILPAQQGSDLRAKLTQELLQRRKASAVQEGAYKLVKEYQTPAARLGNVTVDAIRDSFTTVEKAIEEGSFPGLYYLPSEAACERLGWADLRNAFRGLSVPDDAPQLYFA